MCQEESYFSLSKKYSHVGGDGVAPGNVKPDELRPAETSAHLCINTQRHNLWQQTLSKAWATSVRTDSVHAISHVCHNRQCPRHVTCHNRHCPRHEPHLSQQTLSTASVTFVTRQCPRYQSHLSQQTVSTTLVTSGTTDSVHGMSHLSQQTLSTAWATSVTTDSVHGIIHVCHKTLSTT